MSGGAILPGRGSEFTEFLTKGITVEFTDIWYAVEAEGLIRITPAAEGSEVHPFEDLPQSDDFLPTAEEEAAASLAATVGAEVSPY